MRRVMTPKELAAAMMGEDMGALCAAEQVTSVEHLHELLRVEGHPLRRLLAMVLHTRFHNNRRYNWRDAIVELALPWFRVSPWMRQLLGRTYATYRLLRHAAVPRQQQPLLTTKSTVPLTREMQRALKPAGVHVTEESTETIKRRANKRWKKLWASMEGVSMVLWFDNFYKPNWLTNPNLDDRSVNATVMAVLHVTALPLYPGLPPLSELVRRSRVAADAVCRLHDSLVDTVTNLRRRDILRHTFRVPLDKLRYDVKSLQWKPFLRPTTRWAARCSCARP